MYNIGPRTHVKCAQSEEKKNIQWERYDETVHSGQFDLRHFESEPTVRGRVLKCCDVGRVLRGPRHITSGLGPSVFVHTRVKNAHCIYACIPLHNSKGTQGTWGFMMDETGDYACGNYQERHARDSSMRRPGLSSSILASNKRYLDPESSHVPAYT